MKKGLKLIFRLSLVLGVLQAPIAALASNLTPTVICPCGTMKASDCCGTAEKSDPCPSIRMEKAGYQGILPSRVALPHFIMGPSVRLVSETPVLVHQIVTTSEISLPSPPLRLTLSVRAPPASSSDVA